MQNESPTGLSAPAWTTTAMRRGVGNHDAQSSQHGHSAGLAARLAETEPQPEHRLRFFGFAHYRPDAGRHDNPLDDRSCATTSRFYGVDRIVDRPAASTDG